MITVKLFELKNAETIFGKLFTSATFPLKRSFELLKFEEKLKKESELFEKVRVDAVNKYGTLVNAETGEYQITQENMPQFYSEINDLLNVDIPIEFKKFTIDELESAGIQLTVMELKSLQPFMVYDSPPSVALEPEIVD